MDMRTTDPRVAHVDRRRGHRFQPPKADLATVPGLYATENVALADKVLHLHFFHQSHDWYVAELDQETGNAWGYVKGHENEWGMFNLYELALVQAGQFNMPVERDKWWTPTTLEGIR